MLISPNKFFYVSRSICVPSLEVSLSESVPLFCICSFPLCLPHEFWVMSFILFFMFPQTFGHLLVIRLTNQCYVFKAFHFHWQPSQCFSFFGSFLNLHTLVKDYYSVWEAWDHAIQWEYRLNFFTTGAEPKLAE